MAPRTPAHAQINAGIQQAELDFYLPQGEAAAKLIIMKFLDQNTQDIVGENPTSNGMWQAVVNLFGTAGAVLTGNQVTLLHGQKMR